MPVVDVRSISHVALKTRNVEQQTYFYTQMVGLGETERDNADQVYLRCNTNHHSVVLIPSSETGLDHYTLDVGSPAALEAAAGAWSKAAFPSKQKGQLNLARELHCVCATLTI